GGGGAAPRGGLPWWRGGGRGGAALTGGCCCSRHPAPTPSCARLGRRYTVRSTGALHPPAPARALETGGAGRCRLCAQVLWCPSGIVLSDRRSQLQGLWTIPPLG